METRLKSLEELSDLQAFDPKLTSLLRSMPIDNLGSNYFFELGKDIIRVVEEQVEDTSPIKMNDYEALEKHVNDLLARSNILPKLEAHKPEQVVLSRGKRFISDYHKPKNFINYAFNHVADNVFQALLDVSSEEFSHFSDKLSYSLADLYLSFVDGLKEGSTKTSLDVNSLSGTLNPVYVDKRTFLGLEMKRVAKSYIGRTNNKVGFALNNFIKNISDIIRGAGVRVPETTVEKGIFYIDFVEGQSLRDYLNNKTIIPSRKNQVLKDVVRQLSNLRKVDEDDLNLAGKNVSQFSYLSDASWFFSELNKNPNLLGTTPSEDSYERVMHNLELHNPDASIDVYEPPSKEELVIIEQQEAKEKMTKERKKEKQISFLEEKFPNLYDACTSLDKFYSMKDDTGVPIYRTLTHGDLHLKNVIVDEENKPHIIDIDRQVHIGLQGEDFVRCIHHIESGLNTKQKDELFNQYIIDTFNIYLTKKGESSVNSLYDVQISSKKFFSRDYVADMSEIRDNLKVYIRTKMNAALEAEHKFERARVYENFGSTLFMKEAC